MIGTGMRGQVLLQELIRRDDVTSFVALTVPKAEAQ